MRPMDLKCIVLMQYECIFQIRHQWIFHNGLIRITSVIITLRNQY
jgi:hypothetical protein